MKQTDTLVQQLKAYLLNQDSGEPSPELKRLLQEHPSLWELVREMQDETTRKAALKSYEAINTASAKDSEKRMLERIQETISQPGPADSPSPGRPWKAWKYLVAASLLLIGGIGVWLYPSSELQDKQTISYADQVIRPGSNKALLTLADGTEVPLSTDHEKIVIGEEIAYDDGTLVSVGNSLEYTPHLTLSTPKGGQYQVVLPDGTQVWLNAASTLYYPSRFDSEQRIVQLQGEAYFEVEPDKKRPFIVRTNFEEVKVLGTHFNVNAYPEEPESRVALLEGKVQVSLAGKTERMLKPGQQSIVKAGQIKVIPVHAWESIGWKNGAFNFNNENLEKVMRKLARWYDIDYELDPEVKALSVWGSISRYEDIEKVLEILKRTQTTIQYEIQGRRVIIRKM